MSKRVVITGTSSGIGLDAAVVLAEAGFDVIATMRNLDKRGPLEECAKEKGIDLEIRHLDVASVDSITTCVDEIRSECGPIDALVNNAGFGRLGSVEQLDQAELEKVMATNFYGVWNATRAVLPEMRKRGSGRIVTVTSIGGLIGQPFNDAYCAAKFAVEGMMESLAPVAFELGVFVSLIEPGPVNTEFVSSVYAGSADVLGGVPGYDELVANYAKATGESFATNGQTGTEIARVILTALTEPKPHLRYLTSDYAEGVAQIKYADTTGDALLELSRSRLRPQGGRD